MSITRSIDRHITDGYALPDETAVSLHITPAGSPYIRNRRRYRGGEPVTRLVTTYTRKDGHTHQDTMAFRDPLHARAWFRLTQHRSKTS